MTSATAATGAEAADAALPICQIAKMRRSEVITVRTGSETKAEAGLRIRGDTPNRLQHVGHGWRRSPPPSSSRTSTSSFSTC